MRKNIKVSLSTAITLLFLVISALVTIIFFAVYYNSVIDMLRERSVNNVKSNFNDMRSMTIDSVNTWVERVKLSALSILPYLDEETISERDFREIRTMLKRIDHAQKQRDFIRISLYSNERWNSSDGFYIVNIDNIMPQPAFDQRTSAWFQKAKLACGEVVFTGPERSTVVTDEIVTVAAVDVLDDTKRSIAVICAIILPEHLNKMIQEINRYSEQKTYIINHDGRYVSNEDASKIFNTDFFEENGLNSFREDILNSANYMFFDDDDIVLSSYIPLAGWYLVTTVSFSSLMEDMYYVLVRMIIIAIIIFGVSCVLVALLARRYIVNPLRETERIAEALAAQDFSVHIERGGFEEIGCMQESFIKIRDKLKGTIQSLNDDLVIAKEKAEAARDKAEGANRAKSSFLASMSHEIRTPMNAIIGMSELIRTDNFDKTQKNYFTDIRKMAHALLQIINDILDFSKIEAGKMELYPVHFNILDLYDNICSLTVFTSSGKSIMFTHSFSDKLPAIIYGDELRIRQVITNLVNNAIKYTKEGYVLLDADYLEKDGKEYMVFTVTDSGIGIKEENLPKIFAAFEQVDIKKNRGIMGTGLGLTITNSFVQMMGGRIDVNSVYGKGSTFSVTLPLVHGDPDKVRKEQSSNFIVQGVVEILVVDDVSINLTVALGFLSTHGINADTASGALEAIEKIKQKKYNIVFMDHMMPDIDGVEATAMIRALYNPADSATEYYRDVPVVALTANAIAGMRDFFLQSGMNDFISKPIEAKKLGEVLLRLLPEEQIVYTDKSHEEKESRKRNQAILQELQLIEGLNVEKGLSYLRDNHGIYLQMLREFCGVSQQYAKDLKRLCAAADWSSYAIKIHAIKGICAGLSSEKLREWAFNLECAAKDGSTQRCIDETDHFCEAFCALSEKLRTTSLMPQEEFVRIPFDRAAVETRLHELRGYCEGAVHGEIGASSNAETCAAELLRITGTAEFDASISEICGLINDFEYDKTLEKIDAALKQWGA